MHNNNNILVFGNFGHRFNDLNGQTLKTRNIYELFKSKSKNNIDFFDTAELYFSIFNIFLFIKKLYKLNLLIYISGIRNFKILFPFIFILRIIFKFKIIHIPVGGRHNDFLVNSEIHSYFLSKIFLNLPQTKDEVNFLKNKLNFKNTIYFPNFRINNFIPKIEFSNIKTLKLCFFARVTPEKGIDYIFSLSKYLNKINISNVLIDLYGPIDEDYRDDFKKEIDYHNIVNYKGVINPTSSLKTISNYDVMLLPTRYPGEGFPGTILESYISGVPVISTNWMHIPKFVEHSKTGFLFDLDKKNDFFNHVTFLLNNPQKLYEMKLSAFEKSKEFSHDKAWDIISEYI